MTQHTHIKTLEGGSIDHSHYIALSHDLRSQAAHRSLGKLWRIAIMAIKPKKMSTAQPSAPHSSSIMVSKMPSATDWNQGACQ